MGCAINQPNCKDKTVPSCVAATTTMKFASNEDRQNWIADCEATKQDDTENTSDVEATGSQSLWNKSAIKYFDGSTKKQMIAALLIAGGLYYAYNKGMFKNI